MFQRSRLAGTLGRKAMLERWTWTAAVFATAFSALPKAAHAYTISNALSAGCHESITSQALRNVRAELATAAPLPATDDEQALIDDLQFTPDADMGDLGGATLLASVRDNDLKGRGANDLSALAEVHGDPQNQQEHCLRAGDQKEPGGSAAAVSACRTFIRGRAMEAIAGLDATGTPDLAKRTVLTIHLSLRGQMDAPLPTYYVRIGQAIHAIEDSFTHTYRTQPDEMKITVVLDWLDQVNGTLVESRDGPAHSQALDHCDDADDRRTTRHVLATQAATEFLRATLDPQKTPDLKMTDVDAVLDKYLSYQPGCTFDNQWCNAPEVAYKDPPACGCRIGGIDSGLGALFPGVTLALLGIARRARRSRSVATIGTGLALAGALLVSSGSAHAQVTPATPSTTTTTTIPAPTPGVPPTTETTVVTPEKTTTIVTAPTQRDEHAPPPPTLVPVKEPGPSDVAATAFGAYLGASGSIDKAALAATAGARLRVSKQWTFGLDGEWNPWLALTGKPIRAGAINVYGSAMLRFPLAYENFNLRTTVSLGTSYLLTNLYGAPSGSIGLYGGVSFLGVEWKLSRIFYLIINPLNIAVPVPQLRGVPLLFPQYRFSIGLEMYAG
jgi:hypothetical protein